MLILYSFQYEALAWWASGLGFFVTLGLLARWNDKASKIPYVSPEVLTPSIFFFFV